MAALPTDQDLGGMPGAQTARPIASADTEAVGRGIANLGQGVSNLASSVNRVAYEAQAKTTALDQAKATSAFLTKNIELNDTLNSATTAKDLKDEDPNNPVDHAALYKQNLIESANLLPPEQREKFMLQHAPDVAGYQVKTGDKISELQKGQRLGDAEQTRQTLTEAAPKVTERQRVAAIDSMNSTIDELVKNGDVTPLQAVQMRTNWRQKYDQTTLNSLPANQRIVALSSNVDQNPNAKAAFSYFTKQGWTPAQASGIVGGLMLESAVFNPNSRAKADAADGTDSVGLASWNSERKAALESYAASKGKPWNDFQTQLEFVQKELNSSESGAGNKLRSATNPRDAAEAFLSYERPAGYQGGLQTASNGANRLAHTQRAYAAFSGDKNVDLSGAAAADRLTPDNRRDMLDAATREWTQQDRAQTLAQSQEKAKVNSLIQDDTESLVRTGKPVAELTPDRVTRALGPEAAQSFLQNRQAAQQYHDTTNDWDTLPSGQLKARVDTLAPNPGAAGFSTADKYYKVGQKHADAIIALRGTDPAGSVDGQQAVKDARQSFDPKNPASFLGVVKARITAQSAIGIPDGAQAPISEQEAKGYAATLRPVARGQADVANQDEAINSVVKEVYDRYGPYAKQAMARVLYHVTLKSDAADVLASAMDRLQKNTPGPLVTPDEAKRLQFERDRMAVQNIAAPETAPVAPSVPTASVNSPSAEHIQMLRKNPALAPKFDQAFGTGASAGVFKVYGINPKAPQ